MSWPFFFFRLSPSSSPSWLWSKKNNRCRLIFSVAFSLSYILNLAPPTFPKVWLPYRCICRICRVCRTKKIHRTDRIHSISYDKLYLSFLLHWACTGGFHKVVSVLWIFFVRQIRQIQRYGNQAWQGVKETTTVKQSILWLVKRGKIILLHVRHAFWCIFFT